MYISLIDSHGFFFFSMCVICHTYVIRQFPFGTIFFLGGGGGNVKQIYIGISLITGHDQFLLQIIIFFFAKYGKTSLWREIIPNFLTLNAWSPKFFIIITEIGGSMECSEELRKTGWKVKSPHWKGNMKLLSVVAGEIEGSLSFSSGHAHKEITEQKCCFKKHLFYPKWRLMLSLVCFIEHLKPFGTFKCIKCAGETNIWMTLLWCRYVALSRFEVLLWSVHM